MDKIAIKTRVIDALKKVYDPEIPVSIYDLGLIYDVTITDKGVAEITMTFTTPNCPAVEILPDEITVAVKYVEGVTDVDLVITFDPPWNENMMSEAVKVELGLL